MSDIRQDAFIDGSELGFGQLCGSGLLSGIHGAVVFWLISGIQSRSSKIILIYAHLHKEFKMTAVFLGGSRAVSRLNEVIREQLDNLISKNCSILVGDANGADKALQTYLAEKRYSKVIVFSMGSPRNNVGQWENRRLSSERKTRDAEYFAIKDRAMAQEAKCGLMLWDGESRGTLKNVCELLSSGKPTLLYFSPEKKFHRITQPGDLEPLLSRCDERALDVIKRRLQPEQINIAGLPL